jgi:hypothetical protein
VLLTLVLTGLRRSELCALDWRDLELDGRKPTLLVRSGKGGKSRQQPIPASLARQLQRLANAHNPEPTDPVFCGLQGGRLQQTILADIIARAAKRAGIEKHVTAHTLRHTAATWLRQEMGDTRLVAEYLGHADLSTVARYAHVDREELFEAAGRLEQLATVTEARRAPPGPVAASDVAPSNPPSPTTDRPASPEVRIVVAAVAASMVATADWRNFWLSTQDVARKLMQTLGAAERDGQLALGDRYQSVLRRVLQVE